MGQPRPAETAGPDLQAAGGPEPRSAHRLGRRLPPGSPTGPGREPGPHGSHRSEHVVGAGRPRSRVGGALAPAARGPSLAGMTYFRGVSGGKMAAPMEVAVCTDSAAQLWSCVVWELHSGANLLTYRGGQAGPRGLALLNGEYLLAAQLGKNYISAWELQRKVRRGAPWPGLRGERAGRPRVGSWVGSVGAARFLNRGRDAESRLRCAAHARVWGVWRREVRATRVGSLRALRARAGLRVGPLGRVGCGSLWQPSLIQGWGSGESPWARNLIKGRSLRWSFVGLLILGGEVRGPGG